MKIINTLFVSEIVKDSSWNFRRSQVNEYLESEFFLEELLDPYSETRASAELEDIIPEWW